VSAFILTPVSGALALEAGEVLVVVTREIRVEPSLRPIT